MRKEVISWQFSVFSKSGKAGGRLLTADGWQLTTDN
jgi:hypothetical protein